jgi:hypothetical protein
MKKSQFIVLLIVVLLCLQATPSLAQCAMCKSNLEMAREGGGTNVGNTLNNGIMYLLVLPYAIAGVFGFIYYKKYKEKKANEAKITAPTQS